MVRTTTTYRKHSFTKRGKYKCLCGKKFTRQESDFYTRNPFNIKTMDESRKKCLENITSRLLEKECPVCGEKVTVHSEIWI